MQVSQHINLSAPPAENGGLVCTQSWRQTQRSRLSRNVPCGPPPGNWRDPLREGGAFALTPRPAAVQPSLAAAGEVNQVDWDNSPLLLVSTSVHSRQNTDSQRQKEAAPAYEMTFKATSHWAKVNTADWRGVGRTYRSEAGARILTARDRTSKIGILEYGEMDGEPRFWDMLGVRQTTWKNALV